MYVILSEMNVNIRIARVCEVDGNYSRYVYEGCFQNDVSPFFPSSFFPKTVIESIIVNVFLKRYHF